MRSQDGTMGLWDRMDKRYLACITDPGQVGCPMGSQGTGRNSQEEPSMYSRPATDEIYHVIPRYHGTMEWDGHYGTRL